MAKSSGIEIPSALLAAGDAFRSSRMQRMLSNLTTSYKLYWLAGVFEETVAGSVRVPMTRIAARMVAAAWYPVVYFRLNLGAADQIASCIAYMRERFGVAPDAPEADIVRLAQDSEDVELRSRVGHLCDYVPYRLIRPFYQDALAELRRERGTLKDRDVNPAIVELNRIDPAGAPYTFCDGGEGIEIDPEWAAYFRNNEALVRGWLDMELVRYLQSHNPSVPAVPIKIHRPKKRDLAAAQALWRDVVADHEVHDIYTGVPFTEAGYSRLGPLSIDHFIPWSFVLHDEPWNLTPAFRDVNSSKSDRLPDLSRYLKPFCLQQFDLLMTVRRLGGHRKMVEAYLSVDPHALEYDASDASRRSFCEAIGNAVVPLHQIALNQGFGVWAYGPFHSAPGFAV